MIKTEKDVGKLSKNPQSSALMCMSLYLPYVLYIMCVKAFCETMTRLDRLVRVEGAEILSKNRCEVLVNGEGSFKTLTFKERQGKD